MRRASRAAALSALAAVALAAAPAAAQDAEQAGEPTSCAEIRLEGASARADEDAAFREEWRSSLQRATECLARAEGERACIEVQGQYDDERFGDDMRRVVGGARAAQIQRARGRSGAVVSELVDALGVDYARVRERPPGTEPTFRGATLRVIPDCLPAPPAADLPEWASSPDALEATLRERGLVSDPAPPPEPDPAPAPVEEVAPARGPFSADLRLGLGMLLVSPNDAFTADLRGSLGWGEDFVHARLFLGLGTADRPEERVAFEWGLAGGVRPVRWLRVGARFTHRLGTFEPFDTWLEQSWLLALESEQRIVDDRLVSVWIGEHVTPVGFRLQRATVQNGKVFDTPDRTDYAFVAGVSIIVRAHLGLGSGWPGSPPSSD